jgi:hypothetical protein
MNNDTSRKMLTRNPLITAFFAIESREATWCVNALEDGTEPARVWAMGKAHAQDTAKALKGFGFTNIKIEEA